MSIFRKSISNKLFIPFPNDVSVIEVLQITNQIIITYKFLIIIKTHLPLT